MTAAAAGMVGWGQCRWRARLTPKLPILRLTTRGKARSRRVGSRRARISAMASTTERAKCSGGKGRPAAGSLAADDPQ